MLNPVVQKISHYDLKVDTWKPLIHKKMSLYKKEGIFYISTSALDGGKLLASCSGCFTSGKIPRHQLNRGLGEPKIQIRGWGWGRSIEIHN